jgi:hypothetical protein
MVFLRFKVAQAVDPLPNDTREVECRRKRRGDVFWEQKPLAQMMCHRLISLLKAEDEECD